jgi:hypothetical protein
MMVTGQELIFGMATYSWHWSEGRTVKLGDDRDFELYAEVISNDAESPEYAWMYLIKHKKHQTLAALQYIGIEPKYSAANGMREYSKFAFSIYSSLKMYSQDMNEGKLKVIDMSLNEWMESEKYDKCLREFKSVIATEHGRKIGEISNGI